MVRPFLLPQGCGFRPLLASAFAYNLRLVLNAATED